MGEPIFNKLSAIQIPSILCSKQKRTTLRQSYNFQLATESQTNTLASNIWLCSPNQGNFFSPNNIPSHRLVGLSRFNHLFQVIWADRKRQRSYSCCPAQHHLLLLRNISLWSRKSSTHICNITRLHLSYTLEEQKCITGGMVKIKQQQMS